MLIIVMKKAIVVIFLLLSAFSLFLFHFRTLLLKGEAMCLTNNAMSATQPLLEALTLATRHRLSCLVAVAKVQLASVQVSAPRGAGWIFYRSSDVGVCDACGQMKSVVGD